MKLLLTGFEPFGGSPVNPSQQIVHALAAHGIDGVEVVTAVLPVDSAAVQAAIVAAIEAHRPDVVICLGQATKRAAISIERVAVNLMDFTIPDNTGALASDQPVAPGGPAAYFATLPVKAMLAAVQAANVPAELSLTAGAYLCNQVLYLVLHYLAVHNLPARAGFIHVPALPEQVVGRSSPTPSMSLETMIAGVRAAIGAL